MLIKTRIRLLHDRLGVINAGEVVDMPEHWGTYFTQRGAADPVAAEYQTKIVVEIPTARAAAAQEPKQDEDKAKTASVEPARSGKAKRPTSKRVLP